MLLSSIIIAAVCGAASGTTIRNWPVQKYRSESFEAPGFKIHKATDARASGYLFYGVIGHGYIDAAPLIQASNGDLVWRGPSITTHNFRVQSLDEQDVLTYWSGYGDSFGHGYGTISILDNTYSKLYEVCLSDKIFTPEPASFPAGQKNPCYWDGHESYITDRRTVVGTAYNVTRRDLSAFGGPKNGWIFDSLFYEVDIETNNILFRWSALDHIGIQRSNYVGYNKKEPLFIGKTKKGVSRDLPWDYFHINSVHPVDGGYIVDSRMTWSFYMINGTTGNVEWRLEGSNGGDFTLEKGIFWSWQHMPRLLSATGNKLIISLFNNENINLLYGGRNASTGYLLEVNTKTMHVKALHNYHDPKSPVYATAEGSYQALDNGNALLGYGSKASIKEFDRAGNVVYDMSFAPLTNQNPDQDHGKDVHSYRAYRYEWTAQPTYPPKAAAISDSKTGQTTVYMSWNGATTYDSWNVWAGATMTTLSLVAQGVAKHGFETSQVIDNGYKYVIAEALAGDQSLGHSEAVKVRSN